MGLLDRFKKAKKKPGQLYFALVVADAPLDDAKFEAGVDCKMFITTGEMDKREGIPRITLKEIMERFIPGRAPAPGQIKISEKPV